MQTQPRPVKLGMIGRCLLLIAILAIFARVLVPEPARPGAELQWSEQTGNTMGSTYRVLLGVSPGKPDGGSIGQVMMQIVAVLQETDDRLSTWNRQSELSRFNDQQTTDWVPVDMHTVQLISIAKQLHAIDPRFDPSVAPLIDLWGFGPSAKPVSEPAPAEIDQLLQYVGLDKLETRTDPPGLRKLEPMLRIDLSALAAGHAADRIASLLIERGVVDFYIDVAGEIVTGGHNRDGQRWRVGIAEPQVGSQAVQQVIELDSGGIATSGNYRKFVELDGKRLGHILDPTSGSPAETDLLSVTVIDPSCARADGIATLLMTMPAQEALQLANAQDWQVLMLVSRDGKVIEQTSDAWRKRRP